MPTQAVFIPVVGVILTVLGLTSSLEAGQFLPTTGKPIKGEYFVVFKKNKDTYQGKNLNERIVQMQKIAKTRGAKMRHAYKKVLHGGLFHMNERQAKGLAKNPNIEFVEENAEVQLTAVQSPVTWGLDRIDQRDLPLDNSYTYDNEGNGVHAYIVDTGIRSDHVEFEGRVDSQYFDYFGAGGVDCNGHGTHVAGTVGSKTYGVAKQVTLHNVRVLDCLGNGTFHSVITGLDWVVDNRIMPAVINVSIQGSESSAVDESVNNAVADGLTVVVAAGNSNGDACDFSPSGALDGITVGATTLSDTRAGFSNWGSCVDFFAPGSQILSTFANSDSATGYLSGTSMAAPHVAGIVARYLGEHPNAHPQQDVLNFLLNNSTNGEIGGVMGSPNRLIYCHEACGTPPPPPPSDTTPPVISSVAVGTLTLSEATITWSTNEPATQQVEYGLTTAYGTLSPLDSSLGTNHSGTLSNLTPGTLYHFRVRNRDAAGNLAVSADGTFSTQVDLSWLIPIIDLILSE